MKFRQLQVYRKDTADPLIAQGRIVAVLIEAYIKDLCERVWWT